MLRREVFGLGATPSSVGVWGVGYFLHSAAERLATSLTVMASVQMHMHAQPFSCTARSRHPVRASRSARLRCQALFSWLQPKQKASAGIDERPLFAKKETMQFGELEVSPMGLGTWSWGNQFLWNYDESMDPELQEVFNYAVSKGINLFDTADSYGTGRLNGKSEALLGRFIADYPGSEPVCSNIHIATKFAAYPWRVLPSSVVSACKGSLSRLGAEQLSLGQLHWSASNYAPLQELALWNGLADCYDQGLVRAVGVSNYGPKELVKVHRNLAKRGVPLASAQIQFSLLSYGPEQRDALAVCQDLGIGLISYSPLALGLLSGKYSEDNLPQGPRGLLFRQLLPEVQPLLSVLEEVAQARRKTVSQVAINWCMCKGTVPIPGAKDLQQAKENLGALGWRLSAAEVEDLDRAAAAIKRGMVQNIFQTK